MKTVEQIIEILNRENPNFGSATDLACITRDGVAFIQTDARQDLLYQIQRLQAERTEMIIEVENLKSINHSYAASLEDLNNTKRWQGNRIHELERERDFAIKESARLYQKWMDGINEAMGRKLNYSDPSSPDLASKAIAELVKDRDRAINQANVLRVNLDTSRHNIEVLRKQLTTYKAEENGLREQCENLTRNINDVCRQRDALKANLDLARGDTRVAIQALTKIAAFNEGPR